MNYVTDITFQPRKQHHMTQHLTFQGSASEAGPMIVHVLWVPDPASSNHCKHLSVFLFLLKWWLPALSKFKCAVTKKKVTVILIVAGRHCKYTKKLVKILFY